MVTDLGEKVSTQYNSVDRTRKMELFRIDAIAALQAHCNVVVIAALLRQPMVAGGTMWDPAVVLQQMKCLKNAHECVCSVVTRFVLAVFALQCDTLNQEDSRECRGLLRHVGSDGASDA